MTLDDPLSVTDPTASSTNLYAITTLAWVGDAVFELAVRLRLAREHPTVPSGNLHGMTVRYVSARGQAAMLQNLLRQSDCDVDLLLDRVGEDPVPHQIDKRADTAYGAGGQPSSPGTRSFSFSASEMNLLRRARNHHTESRPKNTDVRAYHLATAFEAVIGWLWMTDQQERARLLIDRALATLEPEPS